MFHKNKLFKPRYPGKIMDKGGGNKKKGEELSIKIKHSKNILIFAGVLIMLLVAIVILLRNTQEQSQSIKVCKSNDDCILQNKDCCGCSMGGQSSCMTKQEALSYQEILKNCPENMACIALYNCRSGICKCQNGKCAGE